MLDVPRIEGLPEAGEELLSEVYIELRRLAAHKMANEAPGQTLQPTALVHEAGITSFSDSEKGLDMLGLRDMLIS